MRINSLPWKFGTKGWLLCWSFELKRKSNGYPLYSHLSHGPMAPKALNVMNWKKFLRRDMRIERESNSLSVQEVVQNTNRLIKDHKQSITLIQELGYCISSSHVKTIRGQLSPIVVIGCPTIVSVLNKDTLKRYLHRHIVIN